MLHLDSLLVGDSGKVGEKMKKIQSQEEEGSATMEWDRLGERMGREKMGKNAIH